MTDGTAPLPAGLRGAVMLLGSFDGMHRGHAALVAAGRAEAARRGAPLAILQCDPHPRAHFAGPSRFRICPGLAQARLIAEAGIDLIYGPRFDAGFAVTPAEGFVTDLLLARLHIGGVIVGNDFRFGCARKGDPGLLRALGTRHGFSVTVVADELAGGSRVSSTAIRAAITAGRIDEAQRLLGHVWTTQIWRSATGWRFADDQILPPSGIWPVTALDGAGRPLTAARLVLGQGGTACADLPAQTALLSWQAPATIPSGDTE
ncbi:Bifunctional riboflavin kinase/FMN adenylyltransferase [Frigidibacter albus]|uniref:FAD synthase n=1 Tax=Frigidibacter mobilis TaxID=1335048 RepID=A0A159Z7B6_9RHOB|nr:riboflavin biosynthesis protein RibF [Frigidibacter mobilis]